MQYPGIRTCSWQGLSILLLSIFLAPIPLRAGDDSIQALKTSLDALQTDREALLRRLESIENAITQPAAPKQAERVITSEDRAFWSFQPLTRAPAPVVRNTEWPRNAIDGFILSELEAKGITPANESSPAKRIRRLYYDVIGLPPTPEAVAAFETNPTQTAYAKVVDELLASPRYGERWARHWLDVARYADSDGYEFDLERPNAYHYRDFVIRAFNEDLPFNTFVKWQLAGDELAPDTPMALAATGFCTSGPTIDNQQSELNRYDELDDMLSTTSVAFLGMTVSCARCHDHKYDAIPTRDYYRMLSAFATTKRHSALLAPRAEADAYTKQLAEWEAKMHTARAVIDGLFAPVRESLKASKILALQASDADKALLQAPADDKNDAQKAAIKTFGEAIKVNDDEVRKVLDSDMRETVAEADRALAAIELEKPQSPPVALTLTDSKPVPEESFLLARGNPDAKSEKVALGFLSVLPGEGDARFSPETRRGTDAPTTFQRAALADWMTDVEHGAGRLTARVIVNRLWNHHFGRGIVSTPNDFGKQGDRPTHPELLDWLAIEFVENAWSLKHIQRLILLSATYQQSSEFNESNAAQDPDNHFLWRFTPQRLEAEIIRDATLSITNCLNQRMYGPGVYPHMPADAVATGSTPKWPLNATDGPDTWRRSVYVFVRRSARMPMIETFDAPDTVVSCGRRLSTVTPTQSLVLMNSAFSNGQATFFAERIREEVGEAPTDWVYRAYLLALNRAPSDAELALSLGFIEKQIQRHHRQETAKVRANAYALRDKDIQQAALTDFAQVVLCLNEFVYVD
ncbi:MAG: DUF1549 and DUF1553 domain-containing protein [Candidatus Hydrogenedentes bacterium]|nr:DUF1549 and DUF1553 domain-containing protein [Candidatus Hydrogenedentota bacterium]